MTSGCRGERVGRGGGGGGGAMLQVISIWVYHVYMENRVCFYDSW